MTKQATTHAHHTAWGGQLSKEDKANGLAHLFNETYQVCHAVRDIATFAKSEISELPEYLNIENLVPSRVVRRINSERGRAIVQEWYQRREESFDFVVTNCPLATDQPEKFTTDQLFRVYSRAASLLSDLTAGLYEGLLKDRAWS